MENSFEAGVASGLAGHVLDARKSTDMDFVRGWLRGSVIRAQTLAEARNLARA